jgi:hypothetical protein
MDIEKQAIIVRNNKAILKISEDALYSSNSLFELCSRLQQVCRYIVAIRYDNVNSPESFFIERTINNMTINQIIDKKHPISNIFWSVEDTYIRASIITNTDSSIIIFPINQEKFTDFILEYQSSLNEKRRKEKEYQEKEKQQLIEFVNDWKKKNPELAEIVKELV